MSLRDGHCRPKSPPESSPHWIASAVNAADGNLLNINEIAAALRLSKMTVYRLIHDGHLPALRLGNSFRIRRSDLDAYLNEAFLPPIGSQPAPSGGADAPPPAR